MAMKEASFAERELAVKERERKLEERERRIAEILPTISDARNLEKKREKLKEVQRLLRLRNEDLQRREEAFSDSSSRAESETIVHVKRSSNVSLPERAAYVLPRRATDQGILSLDDNGRSEGRRHRVRSQSAISPPTSPRDGSPDGRDRIRSTNTRPRFRPPPPSVSGPPTRSLSSSSSRSSASGAVKRPPPPMFE